ncbi:MAG: hypothetical protein V2A79_04455 [Planctomycetota bacterium]
MNRRRVCYVWRGGIILAGLVAWAGACDSLSGRFFSVPPRSEPRGNPGDAGGSEIDFAGLDVQITDARQYVDDGVHLDAAPIIALLEQHSGDWATLSYICEHFYWSTFCWRKASQLNPELREEICARYVQDLGVECGPCVANEDHLEEYQSECLQGIPIFIY